MKSVAALMFLAVGALAQEAEPEEHVPDVGDTIGAARLAPTSDDAVRLEGQAEYEKRLASYAGRQYPPICYVGADALKMDAAFVADGREGLEKLYRRDYKGAKAHFDSMAAKWPGTALSPVGQILVWQALMLENFDFKYESQYQTSYRRARQELEQALLQPGNDAWENFILAGILGIDSIHTMRKEDYIPALSRGYEAMKYVKRARELAPGFPDPVLGDGLFDYWVSVISKGSKAIPDIGDRRAQGIREMALVESRGVFLGPPATLALTFTWIEEGKNKDALASALKNQRAYPDNVINNLVVGRVYMYNRQYAEGEKVLQHIIAVAPENQRAHFYLGRLYLRASRLADAEASLDRYLAYTDVSNFDRAVALYYKGTIYSRQKKTEQARAAYQEAWRLGKLDRAKRRLDAMKGAKK